MQLYSQDPQENSLENESSYEDCEEEEWSVANSTSALPTWFKNFFYLILSCFEKAPNVLLSFWAILDMVLIRSVNVVRNHYLSGFAGQVENAPLEEIEYLDLS